MKNLKKIFTGGVGLFIFISSIVFPVEITFYDY